MDSWQIDSFIFFVLNNNEIKVRSFSSSIFFEFDSKAFTNLSQLFSSKAFTNLLQSINESETLILMLSSKAALPYSIKDVDYDNDKFRYRSPFKVMTQALSTSSLKHDCGRCTVGKFLMLLLIGGLAYLLVMDKGYILASNGVSKHVTTAEAKLGRFWRKPPRLPPRFSPDEVQNASLNLDRDKISLRSEQISRQAKVKEAFVHAWSGYSKYAMGYDELLPLSQRGVDGLGGLGATIVDALDTSMIMGIDEVASEAGTWVEKHLLERINSKGQVNLFETTIRVLGGLLSAYHLSGGEHGNVAESGISTRVKGANAEVLLNIAKNLADRLLSAFTSSPTPIPFSDVVLHDRSAHPAPGGLSSTSEVSTLQLEFNYLSKISGDPKYSLEAMKTLEHFRTLPKVEGLVPIYIRFVEFYMYNLRKFFYRMIFLVFPPFDGDDY